MLRRLLKTAMVLFSLPQLVITDPAARDIILNPDMKRIVLEEQFWRRVTYLCTILDPVCRALGVLEATTWSASVTHMFQTLPPETIHYLGLTATDTEKLS